MRFIDRSNLHPPEILFDKQAELSRIDVQNFINLTEFKGGTRRAPRPDWLDESPLFREQMAALFEGNCAYCESITSFSPQSGDGLIGRHRPEALAQDEDGNTNLVAYAWLMYEWENLLWICPDCARRKGNLFFVEGRRGEPSMPIDELREVEQELMLDPCFHDPSEHLTFHLDGSVNWISPVGQATSNVLDLQRLSLVDSRRAAILNLLERLRDQLWVESNNVWFNVEKLYKLPHIGAATSAIFAYARTRDLQFEGLSGLLLALSGLNLDQQNAFINDLHMQSQGSAKYEADLEKVIQTSPLPLKDNTPSRIPDIRMLSRALKPITRVEIGNFKALRNISFDLPLNVANAGQSPCMLLLGENAMGKSSVLEAIALAVIGAAETAALDKKVKDELVSPMGLIHRPDPYNWEVTADEMHVRIDFLDSDVPVVLSAKAKDDLFSSSDGCTKVVLGYGPRRFFTSRRTRRLRAPAHRVRSLFDPMDMIANPIHWLVGLDDPQFFAAARALREVLMLAEDDDFERDFDSEKPGQIYVMHNGQRVAMKDLSVGFKSVIAMVCDIIREMLYHFDNLEFASALVFIDEIETHLHPRWKMQIMTLLRRAFPKIQFIVTTHDPLCLRGMHDGEVFVLQRSPETGRVERVSELPSIKGMRAEQILTSEFFGLGSTDPETDARLAQYNRLATRIEELSENEHEKLERLRQQLDDDMVIGTTMREQAYAEALKERRKGRVVTPTRASSPQRAELKKRFSKLFERERKV
ncbi:DNA replication and repair protein RecF [Roseovarius albus]|uniref:DNA replication and repair protein RecF n=1 Tax=Roseovarius albus TaxID=1247867 RepID=A0A1X7A559_9RHOB|nr:AAA family ATPase [Roseovarius albus]SLN70852.1 DNA replication and repair protein RecF [Roseovarius albus]